MRTPEIAKQCNVSEQTVRKWIRDKLLQANLDAIGYDVTPEAWEKFKKKYGKTGVVIDTRVDK